MTVEAKYIIYDLFNYFLNNTVDLFFRQIQPRGSHLIPQDGPVFFVGAPHANQFVDPLVLQRHTGRRIFYLIAKKSYDRPLVGAFARVTHSIPVARPQDSAFKGTGKIQVVERYNNPTLLNGINTRFTKDLGPGYAITFPRSKVTAEVEEVLSDTEVRIKVEIKDLVALEALTQQGGTTFKVIPRINQNEVYQSVYDTLKEGNCVGIFPEGGSHDRTELLPLKAGIAVMALGAMAHYPGLNVKIVPCGMNYFHPDKFRSRAVVEYGKPITITQDLVEKFKQGGADKREACSELLSTVSDALKAVTLNTPDYETLMVIQAARRLYRPKNKKFKITRVTELNRRLVAGYLHYKDEPRIQEIKAKVLDYNKQLRTFGIRDHQVKNTTLSRLRASFRLFRRVIGLMFMAVLALPGSILASPIIIAASIVSKQKQKEALATSSVKIRAKDVISSWKILIALGLGPLVYTIYSVIITYLVSYMDVNRFFVWITPIVSLIILPMITYISLIFGERGFDIYRSLPPLFLCMLGDPAVKTLPQTREELSNEITAIINDLGPQLFPELDHTRTFDEHNNEYTPLTPGSVNALNWIMSPFELIGERLFSDYSDAENGSSLSRNTSYTDLPKLAPLSSLSTSNIKLKLNKHEEILPDNVNVVPPSPKTQTDEQTSLEDKKDI